MKERIKNLFVIIKKYISRVNKDNISEYSAVCAYYTILSFIPFIILLITLIQYINMDKQVLISLISSFIPLSMSELVIGIIEEVYSKSIGTISISIIFTLWSAGKGVYALSKGIRKIYNIEGEKTENYFILRFKSIIEIIIFIILIVTGLTILVFGNSLIDILKIHFTLFENLTRISAFITQLTLIFSTFIVFLLVYRFIPKNKVTFKSQIIGAILGSITLNIISFIFSIYLDLFKGFSITYGSLTTLILVMMWVYSCFYTLLLGAELNVIMNDK